VQMTMLIGRILTDGRMSARVKYDVTDHFSIKVNAQVSLQYPFG
jgi:mitochondrial import receptor subunit TOM40